MYPSQGSPPLFKGVDSFKATYPRRMPLPGRSYTNPGPGILSAGDMLERESVIIQRSRIASRIGTLPPTKPAPEKKEKDWIIKRLLSAEGPVGSATNPIIIGEEPLVTPPPSPPPPIKILSEEEKQYNTQQILKTLESVVPLKKRKLPFSAELNALPLPLPAQEMDNSMPVLEPELMIVEAEENDTENRPIPNIMESALLKALTSPPLTMQTKNGVTLHAYHPGASELTGTGNGRVMERTVMRSEPIKIKTIAQPQTQADAQLHANAQVKVHAPVHSDVHVQAQIQAHAQAHAQARLKAHAQAQLKAHAQCQVQTHALAQAQTHALAQAQTHALAQTQAQTHALAQAQTHFLAQTQTHALAQTQTHALAQAQTHFLAQAQTQFLAHAQTHALAYAQVHVQSKVHTHSNFQAQKPAHAQAHAQTHVQAQAKVRAQAQGKARAQAQGKARAQAHDQVHAKTKVKAKVQARAQAHAQVPAQTKVKAKVQARANSKAQVRAQTKVQAQVQARAQAQAQVHAQTNVQAQVKAHAQGDAAAQAQVHAQTKVQAQVQAHAQGDAAAHVPAQAHAQGHVEEESQVVDQSKAKAETQSQAKPLPKHLNQCGHNVKRLIVVPTLDHRGNWVCADYVCKQCGWARKCSTQLNHYEELIARKEANNFTGYTASSGFQRSSPYDETSGPTGPPGGIPPNLECNNQQVVTGNSLLHQTGYRREVAYVDPVPSSSAVQYGMPLMRDGSNLKTYICELCLRVEETLWDMTEHRDTDHLGHPVNFLELCSNEKDALRFRCAAVSESDTLNEVRVPTLTSEVRHPRIPVRHI